jgi:hypothetical protein
MSMLFRTINGVDYHVSLSELHGVKLGCPDNLEATSSVSLYRTLEGHWFLFREQCVTDHHDNWSVPERSGWQGRVVCEIEPVTPEWAQEWLKRLRARPLVERADWWVRKADRSYQSKELADEIIRFVKSEKVIAA